MVAAAIFQSPPDLERLKDLSEPDSKIVNRTATARHFRTLGILQFLWHSRRASS